LLYRLRCQRVTSLDPPGVFPITADHASRNMIYCSARFSHAISPAPAQLWDATGAEVSSSICKIIGGDAGFADTPKNWPRSGLLTDVAYRWDVV
jgi:hypothetical protein